MKAAFATGLITCLTLSLSPVMAQGAPDADTISALPVDFSAGGPPSAGALGGRGGMRGGLELTDEQKEKVYTMKNKLLDDVGPKKLEVQKLQRQLRDLLTKDSIDRKAIEATQDKINALRTDLSNTNLAFKMDLNEMLTPEQRQKIRFRGPGRKMGGHRHHGRGHGRAEAPGRQGPTAQGAPAEAPFGDGEPLETLSEAL